MKRAKGFLFCITFFFSLIGYAESYNVKKDPIFSDYIGGAPGAYPNYYPDHSHYAYFRDHPRYNYPCEKHRQCVRWYGYSGRCSYWYDHCYYRPQ